MRTAFISADLDNDAQNTIQDYLEREDGAEVKFMTNPWEALAFLQGTGVAYLQADDPSTLDAGAISVLKQTPNVTVTQIALPYPQTEMDDDRTQAWLSGEDVDASAREEAERQEQEVARRAEREQRRAEEEERERQAEAAMRASRPQPPKPAPQPERTIADTDELNARRERNKNVRGLNSKVEITPEQIRARRNSHAAEKPKQAYDPWEGTGYCLGVTGPFGGGGKTTFAYYAAQVMAMAFKATGNNTTKTILIESDIKNPKLQNRLHIPYGQDLGAFAKFIEEVRAGEIPKDRVATKSQEVLERICFFDEASGAYIIACPYSDTPVAPRLLKEALRQAVLWAQRTMEYFVILDLDTVGLAEGVELDLVQMCNSLILVTNTRGTEAKKKGFFANFGRSRVEDEDRVNEQDRSHIDDTKSLILKLTRPLEEYGFGIPVDRVRVVFNETTAHEVQQKAIATNALNENQIVGNIEYIKVINKTWAGDIAMDRRRATETAKSVADILFRTTHNRDVGELVKSLRAA